MHNDNNTIRKVIFEIGEDNKIVNVTVLDKDKETKEFKPADVNLGEALLYIYEYCGGMNELLLYEEENEKEIMKQQAVAEFEFEKFVTALYREAFEQLIFDPTISFKSMIALPVLNILVRLKEAERKNRFIAYLQDKVIPPVKDWILVFLFGKENVAQIKELIEEGRKKYLLSGNSN